MRVARSSTESWKVSLKVAATAVGEFRSRRQHSSTCKVLSLCGFLRKTAGWAPEYTELFEQAKSVRGKCISKSVRQRTYTPHLRIQPFTISAWLETATEKCILHSKPTFLTRYQRLANRRISQVASPRSAVQQSLYLICPSPNTHKHRSDCPIK